MVVDEGWRSGSLAAEVMARIMEQAFYDLDAPVARVCSAEVPMPYARHLEEAALPQVAEDRRRRASVMGWRMIEFKLPSLGADMDEGTLLEWKVRPGDAVKRGEVVAVVDTARRRSTSRSGRTARCTSCSSQPGEKVPVGTVLATLLEPGEKPAAARRMRRSLHRRRAGRSAAPCRARRPPLRPRAPHGLARRAQACARNSASTSTRSPAPARTAR